MSYSFRVEFEGDKAAVSQVSGTPPQSGAIHVSGHADTGITSVAVQVNDADGKMIINASGTRPA